jgi:NADH-quinone oxidoreductase subunit J
MQYGIYIASVVGALALLMMMPRRGYNPRWLGAILGAATLGGLWLFLARSLPEQLGIARAGMAYYYIFSAIAIAAAVRVITHVKPVFAALWFILVICASAGLFIILNAEFMAFAMVIIYGGAILVTYVFVIMLAAQSEEGDAESAEPMEYNAIAREPVAAIAAGFLLLAVLLTVMFGSPAAARVPGPTDARLTASMLTNRSTDVLAEQVRNTHNAGDAPRIAASEGGAEHLDNVERIGLDLFRGHPLGLELAGVILLVSLVGAVVIAKKRVD